MRSQRPERALNANLHYHIRRALKRSTLEQPILPVHSPRLDLLEKRLELLEQLVTNPTAARIAVYESTSLAEPSHTHSSRYLRCDETPTLSAVPDSSQPYTTPGLRVTEAPRISERNPGKRQIVKRQSPHTHPHLTERSVPRQSRMERKRAAQYRRAVYEDQENAGRSVLAEYGVSGHEAKLLMEAARKRIDCELRTTQTVPVKHNLESELQPSGQIPKSEVHSVSRSLSAPMLSHRDLRALSTVSRSHLLLVRSMTAAVPQACCGILAPRQDIGAPSSTRSTKQRTDEQLRDWVR
jgi:hypothetical protein